MSTATYLIIALVIAILFAFMFLCEVYQQDKQIKRLKKELDERYQSETYYQNIIDGFRDKMKDEEAKYEFISATCSTSESDLKKYPSRDAMEKVILNKLAIRIGNKIVMRFEPRTLPIGEDKEKYSLVLKVKNVQ